LAEGYGQGIFQQYLKQCKDHTCVLNLECGDFDCSLHPIFPRKFSHDPTF
jgi:hypothetical protein